jgi:hypothetical protein
MRPQLVPVSFDYQKDDSQDSLQEFVEWLQKETISILSRSKGDTDSIRSAIFLFVNRAMEAHLPDDIIGEVLGVSIIRGGLNQAEEELALDEADALFNALENMYRKT